MLDELTKLGLTPEEAQAVIDKYPAGTIEKALKHTVFKTKTCFRNALIIELKHPLRKAP